VAGEKKGRGVFFPLTPLKNRRLHKTPLFVEKMKDQREHEVFWSVFPREGASLFEIRGSQPG